MDAERAWTVIAAERRSLADLLAGLGADQWEQPSLCTGWRVRDVAAHVLLGAAPPGTGVMLAAAVRARFSFHRLNHDTAVAAAGRSAVELVAGLREHAASRRLPPVTNYRNILFDVLVHGQDIAVPLGIARELPLDAARAGADRVWAMGWPFRARRRLAGLRLTATDVDWSVGQGDRVCGPIGALLLLLTGRPARLAELAGPGVEAVARRLSVG